MSIRIIGVPSGTCFTFALRDILISTNHDYVDVCLKAADTSQLLSERYYAYNGNVSVYDIDSLIEDFMRLNNISFSQFTVTVTHTDSDYNTESASATFSLLYCDRFSVSTDTSEFCSENFLTTLQTRRLPVGFAHSLFLFAFKDESLEYKIITNFTLADDDTVLLKNEVSYNVGKKAEVFGVQTLDFNYSQLLDSAADVSKLPATSIRIKSFTVICGHRCFSAYIDSSLSPADIFIFRNCFNIFDIASLPIETTAKTEVERSLASVNGFSRFYNQTASKTYESVIGPLSIDEADWLEQLCTSHRVYRAVPNPGDSSEPRVLQEILITDSTCEVSNGHEDLNTVKFTWRFADKRPLINLPMPEGIFSEPFNFNFR